MITRIKSLLVEDEGLEMVEYALIVAVVALVALGGYLALGTNVRDKTQAIATEIGTTTVPAIP